MTDKITSAEFRLLSAQAQPVVDPKTGFVSMFHCSSAREFYSQFPQYQPAQFTCDDVYSKLETLKKHLPKNCYLSFVGWRGVYAFADDAENSALEELKLENKDVKNCTVLLVTDFDRFWAEQRGELKISGQIRLAHEKELETCFRNIFASNDIIWPTKKTDFVILKCPPKKG